MLSCSRVCFISLTDTGIPPASSPQNSSTVTVAIAKRNIQKIQAKFAMLVTKSCKRLQSRKVEIEDMKTFLVTVYSTPESTDGNETVTTVIESAKTLDETFRALSKYKLWDYLNYYLLQSIIEEFASDDDELNGMMKQYQKDLTGFFLAVQIQVYLDATQYKHPIPASDSDNSDDEIAASLPQKQKNKLFKKLTVKAEGNVTEYTLNYVIDLWQSLTHQFALPQLAMILHNIAKGCIGITWLIPANLDIHITEMTRRTAKMFSRKHVISVLMEDQYIYPMSESTSLESETAAPMRKVSYVGICTFICLFVCFLLFCLISAPSVKNCACY